MNHVTFLLSTLLLVCTVSTVQAQRKGVLPDERELNRLGLTMDWWGQAVMDPSRDQLKHLTADEQNVYGQSSSGIITTFHKEGGRRIWSQLIGVPDQQGFAVSTNDEQVLLSVGMQIYSLDKSTGELLWQLRIPSHPSAPPQVDDKQIYVGTMDGSVYSYDLRRIQQLFQDGMLPQWTRRALVWRFQTPSEIVSSPMVSGVTVSFASDRGIVYGVSTGNKTLKYQFESDGRISTPIGAARDLIFIADQNWRMYCINQVNGRMQWVFSGGAPIRLQPRCVGNQVFIVPHREGLTALSITTGQTLWQVPQATEFIAASDKRVYASDLEGNVLILDRSNGKMIGVLELREFSKRVNNDRTDRIVLGTSTGTLICLREMESDFPVFHLYPERRPILPEMSSEDDDSAESSEEESQSFTN